MDSMGSMCCSRQPKWLIVNRTRSSSLHSRHLGDFGIRIAYAHLSRYIHLRLHGTYVLMPWLAVDVAQLAERQVVALGVAGSSPVIHPTPPRST